jgi:hypothetical protein
MSVTMNTCDIVLIFSLTPLIWQLMLSIAEQDIFLIDQLVIGTICLEQGLYE